MIKNYKGDLLSSNANIIAHQTNCMGVMGSGVAKGVKDKYPEVYDSYANLCNTLPVQQRRELMGVCQICLCSSGKYVANLFGQFRYGLDKKYTEENSLRHALEQLRIFAKEHTCSVALPYKIGCGRGGGNWDEVLEIITNAFSGFPYEVQIWEYNPEQKG